MSGKVNLIFILTLLSLALGLLIDDLTKSDTVPPITYTTAEAEIEVSEEIIRGVEEYILTNFKYKYYYQVRSLPTIMSTMEGDCTDIALLAEYYLQKEGFNVYLRHGYVSCFDDDGDYLTDLNGNAILHIKHDWAVIALPKGSDLYSNEDLYLFEVSLYGANCEYLDMGRGLW